MKTFVENEFDEYRIENHGIIGDTYTAALITVKGTIDWCCFPIMDSDAVFSSLLDRDKGGEFRIDVSGAISYSQRYLRNTNVLETAIISETGKMKIVDYMPVELHHEHYHSFIYSRREIHRIISVAEGSVKFKIVFRPGFGFGLRKAAFKRVGGGIVASHGTETFSISGIEKLKAERLCGSAEISMKKGMEKALVMRWNESDPVPFNPSVAKDYLKNTISFWRNWVSGSSYSGKWKDEVMRSALVLKLLTYSPTGAICAAATTSLPESIGGERNWDYRYSWIRDSSYALSAFNLLGHREEEERYFMWLLHLLRGRATSPERLRVMYTVEGDNVQDEISLNALAGYENSRPVRVGNGATDQLQIDIFGPIIDAIYYTFSTPEVLPDLLWRIVKSVAGYVLLNWNRPDMGIWEMRNGKKRHTHSAVMCWIALDRAAKIAETAGNTLTAGKWRRAADAIRRTVLRDSYVSEGGYVSGILNQAWLDASVLVMADAGIIDAKDPVFSSTLDMVSAHLMRDGLVYRYLGKDGLKGNEGAFLLCTFWYIEALCLAGKRREAENLFKRMLRRSNHLGLLSEEIEPSDGRFLGNFPQAFSHLGLIKCACRLAGRE
ncbi:MAG: glycoside hydrolase family 15 protein [Thermoplasmata archaeon]|nr:glycoside hydrolase family 15 protein [Candidatus Sysuiplasma jiujiangense]